MRTLNLLLTAAMVLAGSQAFAGDKGNGPCKTYFEQCKTSGSKGPAMFKCAHDAATAANDKACLDDMAKHKGGHKHGGGGAGASDAGGASTN